MAKVRRTGPQSIEYSCTTAAVIAAISEQIRNTSPVPVESTKPKTKFKRRYTAADAVHVRKMSVRASVLHFDAIGDRLHKIVGEERGEPCDLDDRHRIARRIPERNPPAPHRLTIVRFVVKVGDDGLV